MTKKRIIAIVLSLLSILVLVGLWRHLGSDTRIALVNFPGFQASGIALSNTSSHIRYEQLKSDELDRFEDYDCVLVFGMGLSWDEAQMARVTEMTERGVPLQVVYATTPENNIMGLDSLQGSRILEYMDSGNKHNYKNLALYIRRYVDKKRWFAPEPEDKIESSMDVFYHIDDRVAYQDKSEFEAYLKKEGFYQEQAPNALVIGGLTDPYSGAKENLDSLIVGLHKAGFNVYPVSSFGKRLDFLKAVAPDIVVYLAHGRFQMGQGNQAVEYLKQLNVPILAPVTIMQSREAWKNNPMGMVGGFMSQTIVMPELDGGVYPYALFTQETNEDGYEVMRAMPDRLKTFTSIAKKFIALKQKSNADKKLAIYFFKGPGQDMLVAQGLETTASLYNTLLRLKAEGYRVDGLPTRLEEFQQALARQAQVFKPYALGQMQQFVDETKPALVSKKELTQWIDQSIDAELGRQLLADYGEAPGEYMVAQDKDGEDQLIVSLLRYGNIALLPQPMAALGTDHFAIVHGAKMPPPYPYVGAYLWAKHAFDADAIMHFGTHGSLEFIPQKQVALGNTDWADQLLGDIPHFYYYTIANIGESMMAKRRSYATTISYITPPFNPSGARGTYTALQTAIRQYYESTQAQLKDKHALEVKKLAMALGIHRELRMDSIATKPYSEEDIERIDNFAEEIAAEKVNASLFTTGVAYTPERLHTTVVAMSADPIAYAKAKLDGLRDKQNYTHNKRLFHQKYLKPATALVERLLSGAETNDATIQAYIGLDAKELQRARELATPRSGATTMRPMTGQGNKLPLAKSNKKASGGHPAWIPKIGSRPAHTLPKEGTDAEQKTQGTTQATPRKGDTHKDSLTSGGKVSDMMAKRRAAAESNVQTVATAEEYAWAELVVEVEQAILNVKRYRDALAISPQAELDAMVNALAGGYLAPSSGGDPVANPRAVPTGRNLYSISAETTPTERAWSKGVTLVNETLKEYQKKHGQYPTKVSYTFWSSEFIESEGASIAQVLYMLGVEPIRDSFGRVSDLRLIPRSELGRPRIDVVIQTSGQFRDLAASRLALITEAIELAASAKDEEDNKVAQGSLHAEKLLVEAGLSPKEARKLATRRIFGGINGMYGTGIQEMITAGDKWDNEQEIAEVYLNNMGASYATIEEWGEFSKPLFRAALANTDVVIQPRQSNTWGALSLDHVYEFMGGLNLTVRNVTGKDPDAFFADYRNRNNFKMQDLKEAIGIESRTTILNPEYIKEMLKGGESSLGRLVEITTNTYGWDVAKPEVIEEALWQEMYQIYVEDKLGLDIPKAYETINPKAMQEVTAVMLETIRKGMWRASEEAIKTLAVRHAELTQKFGATGGGMASSNQKLQKFIAQQLSPELSQAYEQKQQELRQSSTESGKDAVVMSREQRQLQAEQQSISINGVLITVCIMMGFGLLVFILRRKRQTNA